MGNQLPMTRHHREVELVPQQQPVAAVGASYCSPQSTLLQITHHPTMPSRFIVRDPKTGLVCFHKERISKLSTRQTLMDVRDDISNKVAVANAKNATFTSKFQVRAGASKDGDELFQVYAKVKLQTSELVADFMDLATGERCLMGLKGHWRCHQGYLWLDRGATGTREPVVNVWLDEKVQQREVYSLEIASNVDVAMVLVVCMILDERWRTSISHTDS